MSPIANLDAAVCYLNLVKLIRKTLLECNFEHKSIQTISSSQHLLVAELGISLTKDI